MRPGFLRFGKTIAKWFIVFAAALWSVDKSTDLTMLPLDKQGLYRVLHSAPWGNIFLKLLLKSQCDKMPWGACVSFDNYFDCWQVVQFHCFSYWENFSSTIWLNWNLSIYFHSQSCCGFSQLFISHEKHFPTDTWHWYSNRMQMTCTLARQSLSALINPQQTERNSPFSTRIFSHLRERRHKGVVPK